MKKTTLPPLAWAGIGLVACLIALGVIFGLLIKPHTDELTAQTARFDAAYPDSTPAAQSAAKQQLVAAQQQVAQTQAQWAAIDARLMPRYDVSKDKLTAWQQYTRLLTFDLAPHIERWVPTTGVIPLFATIGVPTPTADPNAIPTGPIVIPISGGGSTGGNSGGGGYQGGPPPGAGGGNSGGGGGGAGGSLSVGGGFRRILYHVQRWNSFDRLVLLDNLSLHGTSPFMSASYNAEVIIFPQGTDKVSGLMPTGGGGAGGIAAGVTAGGPPPGPAGPPSGPAGPPAGTPTSGAPAGGAIPGDPAPAAAP